ncbi:MAG: hypothetical protein K6G11_04880 [Lachnospiraceae bacterium]|nr:hypothetical protein [Lachnospiraceae bacterium]
MANICANCKKPLDEGAVFCGNCGARVINVTPPQETQPYQQGASQGAPGGQPYQQGSSPGNQQYRSGAAPGGQQYQSGAVPGGQQYQSGASQGVPGDQQHQSGAPQGGLQENQQYQSGPAPGGQQYQSGAVPGGQQYQSGPAPGNQQYRSGAVPGGQQYQQGPAMNNAQYSQSQPYNPYMQQAQQPVKPRKKKPSGCLIAFLIFLAIVAGIVALIIFVVKPWFKKNVVDNVKKAVENVESDLNKKDKSSSEDDSSEGKDNGSKDSSESGKDDKKDKDDSKEDTNAKQADFEKYGIKIKLKKGKTFTYVTSKKKYTKPIKAKIKISKYKRSKKIDKKIKVLAKKGKFNLKGYEQLTVVFDGKFKKKDVMKDRYIFIKTICDYYNIDQFDKNFKYFGKKKNNLYVTKIDYKGKTQKILCCVGFSGKYKGKNWVYKDVRTFIVPKGYDGIVCGYKHGAYKNNVHVYKDHKKGIYQLFRLK